MRLLLILGMCLAAEAARADWVFEGLGRDGEAREGRIARFVWQGEGGDLGAFPFRAACEEVAAFLAGLGPLAGPAPERIVLVAEIVQGERLRLTRRLARSFELAGGHCVGEGAGVAL